MGLLATLFGRDRRNADAATSYVEREGKWIPADEAFAAWMSADLGRMLEALTVDTNAIDRHFLLMGIVKETYRLRADPSMADKCAEVAQLHIDEFPVIAPALERDMGFLPGASTFQQYATLLTERGEFDRAIQVCEKAIAYGLDDGTKGGYEGRIERIKKKAARAPQ